MKQAVIIDDEKMAREIILDYLVDHPEIEVVEECDNGFSGLRAIQKHKPDIVFLDIQMPKLTGFELLEVLDDFPVLIFSTAYDQYAIKAFEQNAVDYLLKPYSRERFAIAVEKALRAVKSRKNEENLKNLKGFGEEAEDWLNRVVVKQKSEIQVIPVDKIEYIEAQDDYVMIYTEKGRFLKLKTLGYFEKRLNPDDFLRVHRSYIVRLDRISKIEAYDKSNGMLILQNGSKVPASKSGMLKLKSGLDL